MSNAFLKKWLAAVLGALLVLGPTVARAELGSDTGSTASTDTAGTFALEMPVVSGELDGATVAPTPTFTGTAQPGSTVLLFIDGQEVGATQADISGLWSYLPSRPLVDGLHEVKARAMDADGHLGPESEERTFTVVVQGQEDLSIQGEGIPFGCTASGGDSTLVLMGLGVAITLVRNRRRS